MHHVLVRLYNPVIRFWSCSRGQRILQQEKSYSYALLHLFFLSRIIIFNQFRQVSKNIKWQRNDFPHILWSDSLSLITGNMPPLFSSLLKQIDEKVFWEVSESLCFCTVLSRWRMLVISILARHVAASMTCCDLIFIFCNFPLSFCLLMQTHTHAHTYRRDLPRRYSAAVLISSIRKRDAWHQLHTTNRTAAGQLKPFLFFHHFP